jgi:flavodoxin
MENLVFYFSGTGNSLKVTKTIVEQLGSGEIVSTEVLGKPQLQNKSTNTEATIKYNLMINNVHGILILEWYIYGKLGRRRKKWENAG